MSQRRLFIGIPLSPSLTKRLVRETESWPKDIFLKTDPENLHVTLFFLGFIREDTLPDVCTRVRETAETMSPFELHFHTLELLPNIETAKLAVLSGDESEGLRMLRFALEQLFADAPIPEHKSFRPHVTLARMKRARWAKLTEKPTIEKSVNLIEPVDTVTLFESVEIDGKRRYMPLEVIPLDGETLP